MLAEGIERGEETGPLLQRAALPDPPRSSKTASRMKSWSLLAVAGCLLGVSAARAAEPMAPEQAAAQ